MGRRWPSPEGLAQEKGLGPAGCLTWVPCRDRQPWLSEVSGEGSLADCLGPHPSQPWVTYLSPLLCSVGEVTFPLPGLLCTLTAWVQIPKPPPASCVLLKKLLNFSEPPFPPCEMGWW